LKQVPRTSTEIVAWISAQSEHAMDDMRAARPVGDVPCVMLFPYLRIAAPLPIGPWQLEPVTVDRLGEIGGDTSEIIRLILRHMLSPEGKTLDRATLLTRRANCPEPGDLDTHEAERLSLQ